MSDLIGSSAGSGVVPIDPAVGPVTGHPRQASLSTCVKKRISRRNRNCPPFFEKLEWHVIQPTTSDKIQIYLQGNIPKIRILGRINLESVPIIYIKLAAKSTLPFIHQVPYIVVLLGQSFMENQSFQTCI